MVVRIRYMAWMETTNSMATHRVKASNIGTLRNLSKFLVVRVMILLLAVVIETNSSGV